MGQALSRGVTTDNVFPEFAIVRKGADAEVLARPPPFRHSAPTPILVISCRLNWHGTCTV